jgi:hypothetical protein
VLKNIQYIPQQFRVGTSHDGTIRHGSINVVSNEEIEGWDNYKNNVIYADFTPNQNKLCGVASALMVRSKSARNTVLADDDYQLINDYLTEISYGLYMGRYGGISMYKIDINEGGLLYHYTDWYSRLYDRAAVEAQFEITKYMLRYLYKAKMEELDYITIDRGFVSNLSVYCESLYNALNRIWNSINNNREPAIILCDYNAVESIRNSKISRADPTVSPHYNVIAGIRKNNGEREFYVLDPWHNLREFWYTESQMKKLMEVTDIYKDAFWLWHLPHHHWNIISPCYVGIVN